MATGSFPVPKMIGMVVVAAFCGLFRSTNSSDHRHWVGYQLACQRRQPIVLSLGPAEFDRHVAALDIIHFG
jgi:hypothetical protein